MANAFPIFGIVVWGDTNNISLFDCVVSLWHQSRPVISSIVFFTAILIPGIQLVLIIYLLLPLRFNRVPEGAAPVLQILQRLKPWGMVEVLMLGALVSVAKLRYNFSVVPGVALWAFAALTFLFTATAATFSPRDVWAALERTRASGRAKP